MLHVHVITGVSERWRTSQNILLLFCLLFLLPLCPPSGGVQPVLLHFPGVFPSPLLRSPFLSLSFLFIPLLYLSLMSIHTHPDLPTSFVLSLGLCSLFLATLELP